MVREKEREGVIEGCEEGKEAKGRKEGGREKGECEEAMISIEEKDEKEVRKEKVFKEAGS